MKNSRNLYKLIISLTIFSFLALSVAAQENFKNEALSTTSIGQKEKKERVIEPEKSFSKDSTNSEPAKADQTQQQKTPDYVRPDAKARFNRYVKGTIGLTALARTAVNAGISTWRNAPEEWGTKWEGFGKRFASNLGKRAIKNTTTYALDEAFKLDSHFYRSKSSKFSSRLGNALISPVTARNKDGKRVFGLPRIAGTYASSIIAAEAWYPDRYDYKDGLRSGTISLGTSALINVLKEFILR